MDGSDYQGLLLLDHVSWLKEKSYYILICVKNALIAKPLITLPVTVVLGYFIWYRVCAVRKPSLHCREGPLRRFLIKHCPILTERYWPTWWAVNCHMCTILRSVLQKTPSLDTKYERHKIILPDGGIIALDFGSNYSFSSSSPVLLILPGLTGDCYMNYILHFVNDAYKTGFRPVVFNQRGTAGIPIETARLYAATNTEDLEFVIGYIKSIYPTADIVAIGISLGGIILSRYVCDSGANCLLTAAITFSTPLHPASSQFSLEKKWFNKRVYIDTLVNNLMKIVERNSRVLQRHPSIDFKRIRRVKSLSQFDAAITAPIFGYKSEVDYYADACLVHKLCNIAIPYIAIVADDDPFVPADCFPVDEFNANPNTFLISTKHGGHFGFIEGVYPNGITWMNRVHRELLGSLRVYCSNM